MASFINANYQCDNGDISTLRISSAFFPLYGPAPVGAASEEAKVYLNKSTKKYGVRARYALYSRTITVGEDVLTKYIRIAKATPALLASATVTVSYKTFTWNLVDRKQEDIN